MAEPVQVKIGDKIAFNSRYHGYTIKEVLKITPTGIIKTDLYDMNPDLSVRGRCDYSSPYEGEIVTPKIRQAVCRQRYMNFVSTVPREKWKLLTTEALKTIVNLLDSEFDRAEKEAAKEDES